MAETADMAQITKFVIWLKFLKKIVEIAGMWKLHIRKIAVIREIAKVTETKEIAEMVICLIILKWLRNHWDCWIGERVEIAEMVKWFW